MSLKVVAKFTAVLGLLEPLAGVIVPADGTELAADAVPDEKRHNAIRPMKRNFLNLFIPETKKPKVSNDTKGVKMDFCFSLHLFIKTKT